ncbi:MAG: transcription-repair coupling factor [Flavobacteriales bacterium]|nr:transcription-repair coupling factor [Flavobacteriales bacterium]
MKEFDFLKLFEEDKKSQLIIEHLKQKEQQKKITLLKNAQGSLKTIIASRIFKKTNFNHLFILDDLEDSLYFLDDLNNLNSNSSGILFPSSERIGIGDNNVILERIETLNQVNNKNKSCIVTYPEAVKEKIIDKKEFNKKKIKIKVGDKFIIEDFIETLYNLDFKNTRFVLEPGEFAIRGFIIDIFSFSNEHPYRLTLDNDVIDEISSFKVSDQMSIKKLETVNVISNIDQDVNNSAKSTLFSYLPKNTIIWINNAELLFDDKLIEKEDKYIDGNTVRNLMSEYKQLYSGMFVGNQELDKISFNSSPQPAFNKNFEILIDNLDQHRKKGYRNFITVSSDHQMTRLTSIFKNYLHLVELIKCNNSLKEGFIDHENKILLYTDHQIFERHHQYKSKRIYKTDNAISIKELTSLKKGDYITHFDYGIGIFDGLRIRKDGDKQQESIRIIYKNNDVLYISIHSLYKIEKYKEGDEDVSIDKIGSPRWKNLKEKVKNKIKVVAFDLIKLYAKRKITDGFSFSKDTYLQTELEASFMFQDTEDQIKITQEIKEDMESSFPMDRLVCGDVGFGKTEIAIRAAFKAVADNKQVAILVPTTILALQHYKTFTKRLEQFPCTIKYLNRFVSKKESTKTLQDLNEGLVDIIIGTHRIISKDVKFKDLGLLIIDEEQKFGVSTKDKLKTIKENVDTLTLTATPIPRTLQFSLMGSRDLSIMTTYPKNRNPIETTISVFNYESIKDIIQYEISRGGQVFIVHNRINSLEEIHSTISKMCPNLNIRFAHGQMESKKLETTIIDFINGDFDVLITTTIIENGLDIPNANTMIINNAQNFGLADLHQIRGRVGRSNKKAFCYLMTPPFNKMKDLAIKRLNAITNLSGLGDGFNIAMKDLEIRGAGNMLGAEQSGYIEEMGFSNYQKILEEAITEIKETKFKKSSLISSSKNQYKCILETDLELLIPSQYVSDVAERMKLYRRLSDVRSEEEIDTFQSELLDRFGEVPTPTNELLKSISLRLKAESIFCEKLILKHNAMIITFNNKSASETIPNSVLNNIINTIQQDKSQTFSIKEKNDKLKFYIKNIRNIQDGIKIIDEINN